MRVTLNGYVSMDDDLWLYDWCGCAAFSPIKIRKAISDTPADDELVLEINSPGGSVFAGFEMYSLLRSAKCPVIAVIQSIAASAASTIAMGCDTVLMSPVAQMMIHLPATQTDGDRREHVKSIESLDSITESILNGYMLKSGGKASRDELMRLMNNETWLTAEQAIEKGLADGYIDGLPQSGTLVDSISCGIRSISNCAMQPDVEAMRREYFASTNGGIKSDWRATARLNIAKAKYK